jgi:hypothetical protein
MIGHYVRIPTYACMHCGIIFCPLSPYDTILWYDMIQHDNIMTRSAQPRPFCPSPSVHTIFSRAYYFKYLLCAHNTHFIWLTTAALLVSICQCVALCPYSFSFFLVFVASFVLSLLLFCWCYLLSVCLPCPAPHCLMCLLRCVTPLFLPTGKLLAVICFSWVPSHGCASCQKPPSIFPVLFNPRFFFGSVNTLSTIASHLVSERRKHWQMCLHSFARFWVLLHFSLAIHAWLGKNQKQ